MNAFGVSECHSREQTLHCSNDCPMYQLKLHPSPKGLSVISSSLHRYDPSTHTRKALSPVPSGVSPEGLSSTYFLNRNSNGRRNEIRARLSTFGLSSRGGGFLRGREERVRFSTTSTRAYREEDWAKLFQPEALNKEELKEYLNEDPVWLWVFKSWHSGIKGALLFLWTQPGQIKYIEWPSLKSTVKMALLTLVVVMFLMVFLYTVDSLFRHMLKSSMKPIA